MTSSLRNRAELLLRLSETWLRRPPGPNRMVMAVTRRCNLRCGICRTWEYEPERPELTPDEIGAALRPLRRLAWLDVTGGEPFVRDDIEEVFEAVTNAVPTLRVLHFPTNGWFSDRALALTRKLRAGSPDVDLLITVSLDGPPAVHDAMRGRAGSFERALETFRRLREVPGASVYVGSTVSNDNVDALVELESILRAEVPGFTAREWHWNWIQRSSHYFHNADGPDRSAPDPTILERHIARRGLPRDMVGLAELGFFVNLLAHLRGEAVGIPCQAFRSTCFLSPEGDVYPCHVWDRPVGNVREISIPELWNSEALQEARCDIRVGNCPRCFAACEAYPAMAGAPVATVVRTTGRLLKLIASSSRRCPRPRSGSSGP